jgi:hypothetical protein
MFDYELLEIGMQLTILSVGIQPIVALHVLSVSTYHLITASSIQSYLINVVLVVHYPPGP